MIGEARNKLNTNGMRKKMKRIFKVGQARAMPSLDIVSVCVCALDEFAWIKEHEKLEKQMKRKSCIQLTAVLKRLTTNQLSRTKNAFD